MGEVRVKREGTLWFVQASGSGRTWATATSPTSGYLAYVQSMAYTSAQTITTIMERNNPDHHKVTQVAPIDVTFTLLYTGGIPTALSGSGASVPMFHLEYRASAPEIGNGTTGAYFQFIGVALQQHQFTEADDGDTVAFTTRALAMTGPTGSGYIK